jgi:urea carboxylase
MVLDIDLRIRVQLLWSALRERIANHVLAGIVDLTPGIRSLQVHFDPNLLTRRALLDALAEVEDNLPSGEHVSLATRIVHLPLSWDDPATQEAIRKYMRVVRDDAPWCPRNIEFIRRINGLGSEDDVQRIVFDASYLVLGLGDVYLGAPVATPIDPRHRLVTTKYNPARTWTPENAVGIGGAYMCIYGMEGPGGYQFVGRTVPVWNTYRRWRAETPWLLRFFDQIRFFPVSADELLEYRAGVRDGSIDLQIEETRFDVREHHAFLRSIRESAETFRRHQQAAFAEERERWRAAGEFEAATRAEAELGAAGSDADEYQVPAGCEAIAAPMGAQVWKVSVAEGEAVTAGQELCVLAAMKMETPVLAPVAGAIEAVLCREGGVVSAGALLVVIRPAKIQ